MTLLEQSRKLATGTAEKLEFNRKGSIAAGSTQLAQGSLPQAPSNALELM